MSDVTSQGSVQSEDGTSIAFEYAGAGPGLILIEAAGHYRAFSSFGTLARLLRSKFTVFRYDRRGRGDSGDTPPYAVHREIEDLSALIAEAGGSAYVYGFSSGALLALHAAAAGLDIPRLAVLEPPIGSDDTPPEGSEFTRNLSALVSAERHGEAVEYFNTSIGVPTEMLNEMRGTPAWSAMEAVAPTLAYDAACTGDNRPPADRFARISQPVLVATGGASAESFVGGGGAFFDNAADAIVAALPHAERTSIPGQWHQVDPKALAPFLVRFYEA